MNKEIKKYDKNNNIIYRKYINDNEYWYKYDENNNRIYFKNSNGSEFWYKYDENNRIYLKKNNDNEYWYKYDKNRKCIKITKQEFKYIQYNIKIREYNSRTKCSRFEIMEI